MEERSSTDAFKGGAFVQWRQSPIGKVHDGRRFDINVGRRMRPITASFRRVVVSYFGFVVRRASSPSFSLADSQSTGSTAYR
ncbi:hypothetical protein MPTK1_4g02820 [Marchantia polymorpha subsp. ruderalis]|uniref:Uncharacterized protein n=2 Tax=Marchantia polymorpha TaxID=3197 RepID=A0AAF6B5M7_MARPO|nr:hypothetical protein MARPO_0080s0017 [Marchantia polymorpha]BBN07311.1 hypothetical protein Mp_4g02820 [Marchantia polymorpha subsp. ruderalis]|eukprot:PTQ34393.1 hypothetical protein MARPO_0080s0017 [Marchantia polymorpha]